MKKRDGLAGYFVVVMIMFAFTAGASTSKQESTGESIDDSVITTRPKLYLQLIIFLNLSRSVSKSTRYRQTERLRWISKGN